jgi:hypothetical protein
MFFAALFAMYFSLRANSPALWLGDRGKGLSYYGLHKALAGRAERAGLTGFHPHLMRHTAATRWLRAGGSEGGLMAVAGWATRDMIDRYTGASATERARQVLATYEQVEEMRQLGGYTPGIDAASDQSRITGPQIYQLITQSKTPDANPFQRLQEIVGS